MTVPSRRIAVIGAGAVGANIAYRLASRGAEVTVIEAGRPGLGTSASSISWLSSFPQIANATPAMVAYRRRSNDLFRELVNEIGGDWMHWTGTLTWSDLPTSASRLRRDFAAMTAMGIGLRRLDPREVMAMEPALAPIGAESVYAEDDGGWVDAPLMISRLLEAARKLGATVLEKSPALAIQRAGSGIVVTTATAEVDADVVVNAAGGWASHVGALAGVSVPLDLRPGLVVRSERLRTPLGRVVNGPLINIRPEPGGGVAIHWRGEDTYAAHGFNAVTPEQVLAAAADVVPELAGSAPAGSAVGIRPVPPGGPVIGWHPSFAGLFIAVSHGGIGWGPQWGRIATEMIIDGHREIAAEAFAADRFFRPSDRYPSRHVRMREGVL